MELLWGSKELVPALIFITFFYVVAIICYILLVVKAKKFFFLPFFSLLCVFFYYSPWVIAANRDMLGLYILSVFWFLIAWIFVLIRLAKSKNRPLDKHEICSLIVVGLCYLVIIISSSNGIVVTV